MIQKVTTFLFSLLGVVYFSGQYIFSQEIFSYGENFPIIPIILPYLSGCMAASIVLGVSEIFQLALRQRFSYIFKKKRSFTESLIRIFLQTFWIGKIFLASFTFVFFLPLSTEHEMLARNLFRVLFLLYIIRFLSESLHVFFQKLILSKNNLSGMQKSLLPFFEKIIIVTLWISVILLFLSNIGYNISGLLAGAGIAGIAIGLAAQKSIANIFGAITILLNKPFHIGDYVLINGIEGTVKDIGLSYLRIIDKAGHQVMIPNETIISTPIANFSVRENRRVDFTLGIVYSTPLEKVKIGVETLREILESYHKNEKISDDIRVNFEMFSAYSLDIKATYFSLVDSLSEFIALKQEINLTIKAEFEKLGIEMAFPTQEMIVREQKGGKK